MAYFGLEPLSASYLTDYFSGNNTTVAFTLSRAPVSASSVIITISGVKQAVSTYGVSGTTLTFSGAPPTGTNNIEVLHLGVQPDTVVQPSYRTITEFTATAGQTTFSPASYTAGYIDVYRNGVKLGSADFTATNGTIVVLANACAAGDYVRFEGFLITSFNDAVPNTNGAVGDSLIASLSASKLTGSRTIPKSTLPIGSVLQVVNATTTTQDSTTSTSYSATSLNASITPSSATSKILVLVSLKPGNVASSQGVLYQLWRGGSSVFQIGTNNAYVNASGVAEIHGASSSSFLDSPATTSSITYTVYYRTMNSGQYAYNNINNDTSSIALMEIAA